jgi:5,10-methylenetetrahydromethanopterin reductase
VLTAACEVADGLLLSMGTGPHNVAYVMSLGGEGCRAAGRQPTDLELWWNSEVVFGSSPDDARTRSLGVSTAWLTVGSMEGKQIPEHLREPLQQFNRDIHDLDSMYRAEDRQARLVERAKALGLYEWFAERAPGLWGTPSDIANRLRVLDAAGLHRWMFFVGRSEQERVSHIRRLCTEVLPLLDLPPLDGHGMTR